MAISTELDVIVARERQIEAWRGRGSEPITRESAWLAPPRGSLVTIAARMAAHPHGGYSDLEVHVIASGYWELATEVGLDPALVLAQVCEETGFLTSAWSQVPNRNPAGIGITGEPGVGLKFPTWYVASVAHCGRLLAYALKPEQETPRQHLLIVEALKWRPLPAEYRGSAPTIGHLGGGKWAADPEYARKVVEIAGTLLR